MTDKINIIEPHNVTFAHIQSASIESKTGATHWLHLLGRVISVVHAKGITGKALIRELKTRAEIGDFDNQSYHFYSHLGISIQRLSADKVWELINRLAIKHDIVVKVKVRWDNTPRASYPGQTAEIST